MSSAPSLENIFFECLEKDTPAERAAYLALACAGEPELLRRVQSMLQAHGSDFLEQAAYVHDPSAALPTSGDRPGQRIGNYRLVEQIGEGGMGTVWRAEQLEPVQRQVALKLIRAGMDSRQVLARLQAERQALALMDHPHIARVLDGGTDDAGRPYFVMDLLAGVPITRYCDEHKLTVRQRLLLFIPVCEAIQHAHQKGVIHRDIKPSNVLVTRADGRAIPKVIDFGIAKAIAPGPTEAMAATQHGGFLGTPEYMSPEQAAGSAGGIDTRSDIYSLGALLYELLTGTTPLSLQRFDQVCYADILRAITDSETPKPSTRLVSVAAIQTIAAQRCTAPTRLANLVRGELDWIVMQALERDRDRRYATAAAFAADVQRFLAHEPVLACPPSAGYLLRKFVRRHRASLSAAGVLLIGVVVAIGGIGWAVRDRAAQTAEAERVQADRQARSTATVQELLAAADRQLAAQAWPEALATVRRADAAATSGEAVATVTGRVRELRQGLEFVERLEHIRSELATWRVAGGIDNAAAVANYDRAFRDYGIDIEAAATAIDRLRAIPALTAPLVAGLDQWAHHHVEWQRERTSWQRLVAVADAIDPQPMGRLIRSVWGKPEAAAVAELQRLAETIDLREQPPSTLYRLAWALQQGDRRGEALRLLRAAQRVHPGDFWLNFELGWTLDKEKDQEGSLRFWTAAVAIRPESSIAQSNIGYVFLQRHDADAACPYFRRAIELDPGLALPHINLGHALRKQHKLDEAVASLQKAIDLAPNSALGWIGLGSILLEMGRLDETVATFQRAIVLAPQNAKGHVGLGEARLLQGDLKGSLDAARQALVCDPECVGAYVGLGNARIAQGQVAEGIIAFEKAIELEPGNAIAHSNVGNALLVANDPARIDEAITMCRHAIVLDPQYALGHVCLGNALLRHGEPAAAMAAYQKAIEVHPDYPRAYSGIAQLHIERKEWAEAATTMRKLVGIDPGNARIQHNYAWVLTHLGQREAAAVAYGRAAELEPGDAKRHLAHGRNLHVLQRLGEAAAAYRRALELDPTNSQTHGLLGEVLRLQQLDGEAELAYRSAIAVDPNFREAHHGLGRALWRQDKFAEAIAAFETSGRLGPASAGLASELALLLTQCPDVTLRDGARALILARLAVELEPDRGLHRSVLGAALYRTGNWPDALEELHLATDLVPQGRDFDQFFTAMAHWRLGDAEAARASFTRAVADMQRLHAADDQLRRLREEAAGLLGVETPR